VRYGKRNWFFPDAEMPPLGEGCLLGHESVIILNPNAQDAKVTVRLYFEGGQPVEDFTCQVNRQSVRCLRTNLPQDFGGLVVPAETQYAISLHSDSPIVAQYGRLDNRQVNLAFYTTAGYCE